MVDQMVNHNFYIVTRDRDLGDEKSFSNIRLNFWQQVGRASVIYLAPESLSLNNIAKIINESDFELLYLNSFFNFSFTLKPLVARRLGLIKSCSVVLAPRGEFSIGALAIKSVRKKLFIKLATWFGLYRNIIWQASSKFEKQDIIRVFKVDPSSIFIAKDLPPKISVFPDNLTLKANNACRIIFLSRISPMKNLDFALSALGKVELPLTFEIYGPIEDEMYWQSCLKLIEQLPVHIEVNYCGAVAPVQVADVFSGYDLFFFPTRGENYGHVIAEALSVGTPVLLSDQTPWHDLASDQLGWDLPLDLDVFAEKIEEVAGMDSELRINWRRQVAKNSMKKINSEQDVADNFALFQFAVDRFKQKKHKVFK